MTLGFLLAPKCRCLVDIFPELEAAQLRMSIELARTETCKLPIKRFE